MPSGLLALAGARDRSRAGLVFDEYGGPGLAAKQGCCCGVRAGSSAAVAPGLRIRVERRVRWDGVETDSEDVDVDGPRRPPPPRSGTPRHRPARHARGRRDRGRDARTTRPQPSPFRSPAGRVAPDQMPLLGVGDGGDGPAAGGQEGAGGEGGKAGAEQADP